METVSTSVVYLCHRPQKVLNRLACRLPPERMEGRNFSNRSMVRCGVFSDHTDRGWPEGGGCGRLPEVTTQGEWRTEIPLGSKFGSDRSEFPVILGGVHEHSTSWVQVQMSRFETLQVGPLWYTYTFRTLSARSWILGSAVDSLNPFRLVYSSGPRDFGDGVTGTHGYVKQYHLPLPLPWPQG